jgi:hypothetical protein
MLYPKVGGTAGSSIAIIQIFKDILRSINWQQYRILFSGSFYILFSILGTYLLYKYKNIKPIYNVCFLWSLFSLVFILSYGPNPLLEEFRRFIIPFVPSLIIGIMIPIQKYKKVLTGIFAYVKKN